MMDAHGEVSAVAIDQDLFSLNSVIAYSVIVGALMASGKEVAGKIPKGKVCWAGRGCCMPAPCPGGAAWLLHVLGF